MNGLRISPEYRECTQSLSPGTNVRILACCQVVSRTGNPRRLLTVSIIAPEVVARMETFASDYCDEITPKRRITICQGIEDMAETYQSFAFSAQAAARRGEWNDVTAVLDWLGSADLPCHPINTYGPRRRGEPHNLGLFAVLILFEIACHAARNLHHLSD
jgi:hypothetical protein